MESDLYSDLYNAFDSDPTPAVECLAWLAKSHSLPVQLDVLDVGCGPGRMLRPLTQLGWRVTGMEPDPAFRSHAERAAAQLPHTAVRPGGFNDIAGENAFDLIIGINSSFAHVLTAEDRADAFLRCHRALRPGGVLFLDLPNLPWILREYAGPQEHIVEQTGKKIHLVRRHEIDYHAGTFTTHEEYTVTDSAGEVTKHKKNHPYAITAFPDLAYLLRQATFHNLRTFRSYSARESQRLGQGRMMVSAQKT